MRTADSNRSDGVVIKMTDGVCDMVVMIIVMVVVMMMVIDGGSCDDNCDRWWRL